MDLEMIYMIELLVKDFKQLLIVVFCLLKKIEVIVSMLRRNRMYENLSEYLEL